MTQVLKLLLCSFLVFTIISCDKDLPAEDLQIHYKAAYPLKDVIIVNDTLLACGGETFESGYVLKGHIDEDEFNDELLASRCLNAINYDEIFLTAGVYAVGERHDENWEIIAIPDLFIMREMIAVGNQFYAVGGAGLSSGVLYTFDESLSIVNTKKYVNDLSFIREINGRIYVGGFGLLMVTDDFIDWTIIDEYEDHFIDIEFSEETGILVLGASGRIIRSNNEGATWDEFISPKFSGVSEFTDLLIYGEKIYLADGENICASGISNIDWQKISFNELGLINRLVGNKERVFFVTNTGTVASIVH